MTLEIFLRLSVLVLSVATLTISALLFAFDKNAGGSVFAGAFVISLVFVFLIRFKKFTGLGIQAELWEQAQFEAEELSERLRALASVVSERTIDSALRIGRWGSYYKWSDLVRMRQEVVTTLNGVADKKIIVGKIDRTLLYYLASDYFHSISGQFRTAFQECHSAEQVEINKEFGSPITNVAGYNARVEDWQKKRRPLENLADVAGLARDRKLGLEMKRAFQEGISLYGSCLSSKLLDISSTTAKIETLIDIETMENFDPQALQDVFAAIRKAD